MAGEQRGTYIYVDGEWKPGVTVKGSKGEKGDPGQGLPGDPGEDAAGIIVRDEPPANPSPWETVWLDVGGATETSGWHVVGAASEPAYQGGWLPFGAAPWSDAAFFKTAEGLILMRGLTKSGTATEGTVIFTLPPGFRPTHNGLYICSSGLAPAYSGRVGIMANGQVQVFSPSTNAHISFDGIVFQAAAV